MIHRLINYSYFSNSCHDVTTYILILDVWERNKKRKDPWCKTKRNSPQREKQDWRIKGKFVSQDIKLTTNLDMSNQFIEFRHFLNCLSWQLMTGENIDCFMFKIIKMQSKLHSLVIWHTLKIW